LQHYYGLEYLVVLLFYVFVWKYELCGTSVIAVICDDIEALSA